MFGSRVQFAGLAYGVDLLPVEPNPISGIGPYWKISNEYISGMDYLIHSHVIESSFAGIWERTICKE